MKIGCVYKHPTCNLEQFRSQLNDIIKTLNPNRHEIYILGDMNIDFLKYIDHSQTEEFLDMLFANNISIPGISIRFPLLQPAYYDMKSNMAAPGKFKNANDFNVFRRNLK